MMCNEAMGMCSSPGDEEPLSRGALLKALNTQQAELHRNLDHLEMVKSAAMDGRWEVALGRLAAGYDGIPKDEAHNVYRIHSSLTALVRGADETKEETT